ncbi:MAG: hypothetical protein ACOY5F_04760 [Pseudomonadota bacterium]
MLDLAHLDDLVEDQDRGAEMTVVHPVTGEAMPDMVFIVAGPDSDIQRRARLRLSDDLLQYRHHVPAHDRERFEIEFLARCVIGWRIRQGGREVEFSHSNVVKLITKHRYIRQQLQAFTEDRTPYFARTPFIEVAA